LRLYDKRRTVGKGNVFFADRRKNGEICERMIINGVGVGLKPTPTSAGMTKKETKELFGKGRFLFVV
jgi:hypothetical protein